MRRYQGQGSATRVASRAWGSGHRGGAGRELAALRTTLTHPASNSPIWVPGVLSGHPRASSGHPNLYLGAGPTFHRHRPVSYSCLWKAISARQSSLTRRCLRLRFLGPFPDLQTLRRREWRLSSALASCGTGGPLAGGPTAEPCED